MIFAHANIFCFINKMVQDSRVKTQLIR